MGKSGTKKPARSAVINRLVWLALVVTILGALLLMLGQYRADRVSGPRLAAADQVGRIYIISDRTVYVFDEGGVRRETIALSRFGISNDVSDFVPMPDGDWLLADAYSGDIKRCNPRGGECLGLVPRVGGASRDELGVGRRRDGGCCERSQESRHRPDGAQR